jgi:hypothetical protein
MSENNVYIMTAICLIYLLLISIRIMKFRYICFSADERGITLR